MGRGWGFGPITLLRRPLGRLRTLTPRGIKTNVLAAIADQFSATIRSSQIPSAQESFMYSRIISCAIDPSRIEEFRTVLNGELLPRIQEQPGFVENIESLDHTSGEFCCTTLWNSKS